MSASNHVPNVPQVPMSKNITHPKLRAVIEKARGH